MYFLPTIQQKTPELSSRKGSGARRRASEEHIITKPRPTHLEVDPKFEGAVAPCTTHTIRKQAKSTCLLCKEGTRFSGITGRSQCPCIDSQRTPASLLAPKQSAKSPVLSSPHDEGRDGLYRSTQQLPRNMDVPVVETVHVDCGHVHLENLVGAAIIVSVATLR